MDKVYSPAEIEQRLYQHWEAAGYFAPRGAGAAYCIVIPPPNVTGTLHMGHAFQDTIMDALTRACIACAAMRRCGSPGTDHAGIATQMVVERQLNAEGKRRTDLTREAIRRARLGVEGAVRRHHRAADAAPRRLGRLVARALHDGPGAVATRSSRRSCACTSRA